MEKTNNDIEFTIKNKFSEKTIILNKGNYYNLLEIKKIENPTKNQIFLQNKWLS